MTTAGTPLTGIGRWYRQYLTTALMIGDMNAVLACTLIVGLVFICLNLITDLLYRFLDPRTR